MWWKATLWLSVALVTAICAKHMTIDKQIHPIKQESEPASGLVTGETEEVIQPPVIDSPRVGASDEKENSDGTAGGNNSKTVDQPETSDEPRSEARVSQRSGETREDTSSVGGDSNENGSPDRIGDSNESSGENDQPFKEGQVITTDRGKVKGWYKHDGIGIQSFLDIPYGKFDGLFKDPTEAPEWEDIHEANDHDKRCPQLQEDGTFVGATDCLTLSVFIPRELETREQATGAKVLFHIHDGNFVSGSGDPSIYGPEHLVTNGIILVLPNYRLGPLGFLCLKSETAPGNAALKDLTLALDWTKRNIKEFGGDPENIIVSGDGASGALVGYLALSPKSKNYISKVIIESGSVLSHWALDREPIATATSFAEKISDDSTELLNVFETVDVQTLVEAAKGLTFKPCIESENKTDAFINKTPWKLLNEEKTEIYFMIGAANHAGMHEALSHKLETLVDLDKDFFNILPNDLKFETDAARDEIAERVKYEYFKESSLNLENMDNLSLCYTDSYYLGPVLRAARSLVEAGATVYLYEFAFLGDLNREHNSLLSQLKGAARGDIIGYIFCQDGQIPVEDSEEERMVHLMTNLWVNFLQTGKPLEDDNVEWKKLQKVEDSEEQWLLIDSPKVSLKKGLHLERMRLWTDIYDKYFIERSFATKLISSFILFGVTLVFVAFSSNFS